jgi:hypothetical protein
MAVADGSGLPLALSAFSAAPHEVTLVGSTLDAILVDEPPHRLIADKVYDSDLLFKADLTSLGQHTTRAAPEEEQLYFTFPHESRRYPDLLGVGWAIGVVGGLTLCSRVVMEMHEMRRAP